MSNGVKRRMYNPFLMMCRFFALIRLTRCNRVVRNKQPIFAFSTFFFSLSLSWITWINIRFDRAKVKWRGFAMYRVSIYSWNILWRIDSGGQNKHKSWYAKMLVEAWLLSYKQFKVFVRWNEVETEGNDGDRAILLYLEFHFAKRKLRLLII